jgi:hypothetical protein
MKESKKMKSYSIVRSLFNSIKYFMLKNIPNEINSIVVKKAFNNLIIHNS